MKRQLGAIVIPDLPYPPHHPPPTAPHTCAGQTVLVLGAAGGVGVAALQISKLLGARVVACAAGQVRHSLCACAHVRDVCVRVLA